ncbi:uncharacterized protein [Triticum aestivum]|uniref:uncharacterized protein isoform X2 n=1 Tax=Triticum aestivum TaxID=4565 RepID=UPI001D01E44C|nr:uncharacterized protein LOC123111271 isoform X2 [Triticum aestivum]
MPTLGGGSAGSGHGVIKGKKGNAIADSNDPARAFANKFRVTYGKDESEANSEDWNSILSIEKMLSLPPDREPKEYFTELDQNLYKVVKTIEGRKLEPKRERLVKDLRLLIEQFLEMMETGVFLNEDRQRAALQAKDWLEKKLKVQSSVPLYEDPVLKCSDLDRWIKNLSSRKNS